MTHFFSDAEGRYAVVSEVFDAFVFFSQQYIRKIFYAKPLPGSIDAGHGFLDSDGPIPFFDGFKAVIAIPAFFVIRFPKIIQQYRPPAVYGFTIPDHGLQTLVL